MQFVYLQRLNYVLCITNYLWRKKCKMKQCKVALSLQMIAFQKITKIFQYQK